MSYTHQTIGTIVSSVLNYDQLCASIGENPSINNAHSSYVPCDGRSIVGSTLEKLTQVGPTQPEPKNHIVAAPDLRGKFMRGLNLFYSPGQPDLNFQNADPEGTSRTVGEYQGDSFRSHNHPVIDNSAPFAFQTPGMGITSDEGTQVRFGKPNIVIDNAGGAETRPKNLAFYSISK